MRLMTTTPVIPAITKSIGDTHRWSLARLVGVAIASLVPAVFWSVIIELVSLWAGKPISPLAIAIVCCSITLFLVAVCAPLMLRRSTSVPEPLALERPIHR
jgi:hypothetical protein